MKENTKVIKGYMETIRDSEDIFYNRRRFWFEVKNEKDC